MNDTNLQRKVSELGLTQKEVSKSLCVSESAVSLWLSGDRKIPRSIEKLFCLVYGYEYDPSSDCYDDENQPYLFDLDDSE